MLANSSEQASFTYEIMSPAFALHTHDTYVKRVWYGVIRNRWEN